MSDIDLSAIIADFISQRHWDDWPHEKLIEMRAMYQSDLDHATAAGDESLMQWASGKVARIQEALDKQAHNPQ
jgi:hypothetical protein